MKIGILGATGNAGRGAAYASDLLGHDVVCGCRNPHNFKTTVGINKEVDIFDESSLKTFVQDVDVVIDCSGPAYKTGYIVAKMCDSEGKNLISVSGNDTMVRDIKRDCLGDGKLLLSSGVYPGLCELMFSFVNNLHKEDVKLIEEVFYDNSRLSDNALSDIAQTIFEDEGEAFACWRNSGINSIEKVSDSVSLKDGEKIFLLPMCYKEFECVCQKNDPKCAVFYQGFGSESDMHNLIRLKEMKSADMNEIRKMFLKENEDSIFMIINDVKLENGECLRYVLRSEYDSAYMSGVVASVIFDKSGALLKNGVHFAAELDDSAEIIKTLKELGFVTVTRLRRR